ncbi:MAG TPA: hypothetical protein P5121_28870 [Caldilineaceae bacterium]|nr:hypothetical protein [Caldilineaceae bacterium]
MVRQSIAFEWQIGDEIEWQEGGFAEDERPLGRRFTETQLAMALLRGLLLTLLALSMAGSRSIPKEQLAQQQADKAVRFALMQEKLLQDAGAHHRYATLLDGDVNRQWQNRWRTTWETGLREDTSSQVRLQQVDYQQELAIATVLIRNPAPNWGENSTYREKRYYRLRGQSWLRTVPDGDFWGPPLLLETEHFRFEYYAPDASAILAISRRIDRLYTQLYDRLDMAPPSRRQKQTFGIVPEMINSWRSYENRVELTSPALALVPVPLSDEAYLLQTMTNRLTYFAVQESMARTRTGTEYRWNLMLWGVRSWLLQDLLGQQAPWSVEAENALRSTLAEQAVVELDVLNRGYSTDQPDATKLMARYMLAESVVAYGLATYGVERLPILLQDFSVYSRWKDLVPRAFGVSLEEFETGWRAYVTATYGDPASIE